MAHDDAIRYDVVGLGLAVVDHLARVAHPLAADETLQAAEVDIQGGGPVATGLVTLACLGARTAYLGTVADDARGRFILDEFRRYGVDASAVVQVPGARTAMSLIIVSAPYRAIAFNLGNVPNLTPEQLPADMIRHARILHLDGGHREAALAAACIAHDAGVTVSLDGGAGEFWRGLDDIVRLTDVLVVARRFAEMYTGEAEPQRAGPKLLAYGARLVGITDGLAGSWLWTQDDHFHQPAFAVQTVDSTGAGDVYHGAFLYGLVQGWPLRTVTAFASATAALKCGCLGGRAGIPTRAQVLAFLRAQGVPVTV